MIALRPMAESEFRSYLAPAIRGYARQHRTAGDVDPKKALARARADYDELLPHGLKTPGQFMYSIVHAGKAVGMLWFELKKKHGKRRAFIFDFQIMPSQRGKGFGRKALRALEREARRLGAQVVGLHVFGHNRAARALYETSGYRYTSMHMNKPLRR
jgi:ribosomal protein S18 acetylase RimI-like enzyme